MNAGNIGNIKNAHNQYQQFQNNVKPGKGFPEANGNSFTHTVDTYTPSEKALEAAADPAAVSKLWKDFDYVADAVRKLVASALGKDDASGQGFWGVRAGGSLKLSEADRAQAQELIGEDGYFGVKQTTARIMDFAKALVGENASDDKIELMRDAVQKGFDEVSRLFGGFDNLPDVTKQTYDAIMKAFDEWLSGGAEETAAEEE